MLIRRPERSEYDDRYRRYVELVQETDLAIALSDQLEETLNFIRQLPSSRLDYRYAPDKWTLREVVGHVLDTERLFGFRLFCIARGDPITHAVAEENTCVRNAEFHRYTLNDLSQEFEWVRRSHISLVQHLPEDAWDRRGMVGGLSITVRALGYIMVGHELHHWRVVQAKY